MKAIHQARLHAVVALTALCVIHGVQAGGSRTGQPVSYSPKQSTRLTIELINQEPHQIQMATACLSNARIIAALNQTRAEKKTVKIFHGPGTIHTPQRTHDTSLTNLIAAGYLYTLATPPSEDIVLLGRAPPNLCLLKGNGYLSEQSTGRVERIHYSHDKGRIATTGHQAWFTAQQPTHGGWHPGLPYHHPLWKINGSVVGVYEQVADKTSIEVQFRKSELPDGVTFTAAVRESGIVPFNIPHNASAEEIRKRVEPHLA